MISIIIPTFNYGHYITETIYSVLNQTYQNWECIIIDDGSTDDTREKVNKFLIDTRIKYIHQKNQGLSSARNTGLINSNGSYILFLDADDLISKDKLEQHVIFLLSHPNICISYSDFCYFDTNNPDELFSNLELDKSGKTLSRINGTPDSVLNEIIKNNIFPVNAALIKTSFMKQVGFFDEQLSSLEDWDFWFRCVIKGAEIGYLGDGAGYAIVRVHRNSMSKNKIRMLETELTLRTKIARTLSSLTTNEVSQKKFKRINLSRRIKTLSTCMILYNFNKSKLSQFFASEGCYVFCVAYIKSKLKLIKVGFRKFMTFHKSGRSI